MYEEFRPEPLLHDDSLACTVLCLKLVTRSSKSETQVLLPPLLGQLYACFILKPMSPDRYTMRRWRSGSACIAHKKVSCAPVVCMLNEGARHIHSYLGVICSAVNLSIVILPETETELYSLELYVSSFRALDFLIASPQHGQIPQVRWFAREL